MAAWNDERLAKFSQGIALCFSRWTALQLAIDNSWGGRDSAQKAQQLVGKVATFVIQSKDLYIDDLEEFLDGNLMVTFNSEVDDGSVEDVAEIIMYLNQECKSGDFSRVQQLSSAPSGAKQSVCQDQQEEDDEDAASEDEEMKDAAAVESAAPVEAAAAGPSEGTSNPASKARVLTAEEIADGWEMVAPKGRSSKKQHARAAA